MAAELPNEIDCRRLLSAGGKLDGSIAQDRLRRVEGNFRVTGPTGARLELGRDRNGRWRLRGSFDSALEARCQRCLEWMSIELRGELDVEVVDEESRASDDEFVVATDGRLDVVALIEDELLLACPMIPLHEDTGCRDDGSVPEAREPRQRPFAGLGEMLAAADDEEQQR